MIRDGRRLFGSVGKIYFQGGSRMAFESRRAGKGFKEMGVRMLNWAGGLH